MDQRRDNHIMSIVRSCEELAPTERVDLLDRECAGDGKLRDEIELLLGQRSATMQFHIGPGEREKALPAYYKLVSRIGVGGMAEVYLAEDTRLNRRVAIKFLNDAFRNDADRMRRFRQEAKSA